MDEKSKLEKRTNGVHYTPSKIFEEYIFPKIKDILWNHCWIDLYCGEGNLIFPILEHIPKERRMEFFTDHVRMFDIDASAIKKCISRAVQLGISEEVATKCILNEDTLKSFPKIDSRYAPFHITNPPYLYLGYISKHPETQKHLKYFEAKNEGLQDLYQIALANDANAGLKNMIYVIPSNFLFGDAISNNIRELIFPKYHLKSAIVFEKKIFSETGVNVMIGFFSRKTNTALETQEIEVTKINSKTITKTMSVSSKNNWRAGGLFDLYLEKFRTNDQGVSFYLLMKDILENPGNSQISLIDSSDYSGSGYRRLTMNVSNKFADRIKTNLLWLRTVDTGSDSGKVGIYNIKKEFSVDGIVVGNNFTYRTSPIQIFFEPALPEDMQYFVQIWVNSLLTYLRELTDSEFMTTYKYSESSYTRKYLGLKQAKALIYSCPLFLDNAQITQIKKLLEAGKYSDVFDNAAYVLNSNKESSVKKGILAEQTVLSVF